jgi:hypothetical protein
MQGDQSLRQGKQHAGSATAVPASVPGDRTPAPSQTPGPGSGTAHLELWLSKLQDDWAAPAVGAQLNHERLDALPAALRSSKLDSMVKVGLSGKTWSGINDLCGPGGWLAGCLSLSGRWVGNLVRWVLMRCWTLALL